MAKLKELIKNDDKAKKELRDMLDKERKAGKAEGAKEFEAQQKKAGKPIPVKKPECYGQYPKDNVTPACRRCPEHKGCKG
jgi:hypothetical protein